MADLILDGRPLAGLCLVDHPGESPSPKTFGRTRGRRWYGCDPEPVREVERVRGEDVILREEGVLEKVGGGEGQWSME